MSTGAPSSQARESSRTSGASDEQNNNNNNNNNNNPQGKTMHASDNNNKTNGQQPGGLMRKRSSVQSNLSRHSNGGGHSLSSSATNTSNEDIDQPAASRMSNAEYEHVRNTTLLFFLDRLYLASQEGKEARTLHDLSCLFGTREFTKEMRQIVGASRNGLKKFLQSYPSLFQIEGDKVHLTQLKQDTQVAQRDYNKEAVEYFRAKLLQFGTSLVPIKNLFGYRSQASQEVRHVSGKNTHDFKEFLALNEDVFEILADEHVMLKTALAELELQGQTSMSLQQSLAPLPADDAIMMDPYLNKQFAHLVEECMQKMIQQVKTTAAKDDDDDDLTTKIESAKFDKVKLEQLYEQIQKQCQNELFLKMVKTLDDLRVFLRMHPKLFKRSRCDQGEGEKQEFVSLLSESERRELEAATYPSLQRQHSTLATSTGPTSLHGTKLQVKEDQEVEFASLPPQSQSKKQAHYESSTTTRQVTAAPTKKTGDRTVISAQAKQQVKAQEQQQPLMSRQPSNSNQGKQVVGRQSSSSLSSHQNHNQHQHHHQLRANAPPFVPPSREQSSQHQQYASLNINSQLSRQNSALSGQPSHAYGSRAQNGNNRPLGQRSHSNLNQTATTRHHQQHYSHHEDTYQQQQGGNKRPLVQADLPPIDHRSAIRNYLLKDTGSNQSQHMSWTTRESLAAAAGGRSAGQGQQVVSQPQPPPPSADEMRARTVDMVREASNIITKIMTTADAVAFDCKGYNLGFDGQITLIQFGYVPRQRQVDLTHLASSMRTTSQQDSRDADGNETPLKPEVCVFDLITNPELAYCLKPLLESDKIVKIVHDVRNKSNALYVQFKIILNNVFDTQVANLVIQQQDTGKPAYKSRYISMSKLCEIYGGDELMRYRNLIKQKTSRAAAATTTNSSSSSSSASPKDVNYWRARPLTKPMIFEATMDVYCLVGGIYQNLKSKIKPEYEPLFDQLNLEGVLARIRPDEIRSAKKERKIDLEVIDLKRKLYSDTLGPVVLSNREIRLLRHIDLTDEVRAKIQQCKKVAKKLERLDMKAAMLLEAKQMSLDGALSSSSSLSSNGTAAGGGGGGGADLHSSLLPAGRAHLSRQSTANSNQSSQAEAAELELKSITSKLDELNATGMMMDSSMFDELKEKMIESSSLLESLEDDDDDELETAAAVQAGSLEAARGLSLSGPHSHQGSTGGGGGGDCCHCQCHTSGGSSHSSHTSTDLTTARAATTSEVQTEATTAGANDKPPVQRPEEEGEEPVKRTTAGEQAAGKQEHESDLKSKGDIEEEVKLSPPKEGDDDDTQTKGEEPTTTTAATNDLSIASDESKSSAGCDIAVQCDLLS